MNVEDFLSGVDREIEYGPGHAIISANISNWIVAIDQIIDELADNGTVGMLTFNQKDVDNASLLLMAMILNVGIRNGVFGEDNKKLTEDMINELDVLIDKYTKSPTSQ